MNINDIYLAKDRLLPYLSPTPLIFSTLLSQTLQKKIWLKLETQQPTGSFKPRPAFNSILANLDNAREKGVIASSSGNFAQGVAYAAKTLGVSAVIVMIEKTSPYKIARTKALGAEVVLCGNSHEERVQTTLDLQASTGRVLLHPYDSEETIAGDGTLALELIEQLQQQLTDMTILVPISGGGLIAGIAFTLKTLNSKCQIIGIQPAANGSMAKSFQAGKCINIGPVSTVADALIASEPGKIAFKYVRQYVDDIILVGEEEILQATEFMIEQHKLVVEPGAAVGIAALFAEKVTTARCTCIITGGNIKLWQNQL